MGDELDIGVIKKTQETLGKVMKKPPLTEKLLRKPPFRFLHDIMTSVINTTGFMKGLYTTDEMNSEEVKDKEKKIAFLQKAIDVLVIATGKSLSVRPSKIVAGLEAEKTNEFLQTLGKAILNKVDSTDAVEKVLNPGSLSTIRKKDKPETETEKKLEMANGNLGKSQKENKEKTVKKNSKENVEKVRSHRDVNGEKVLSGDRIKEKQKPSVKPQEKLPRSKESPKNVANSSSNIGDNSLKKSGVRETSPVKSSKMSMKRSESIESPKKRVSKESPEKRVSKESHEKRVSKESPEKRLSSKESPEKRPVKESPKRKLEKSADGSKRGVGADEKTNAIKVDKLSTDEPVQLLSNNMLNGDGEIEVQEQGKIVGRPPTGRPGTAKLNRPRALSDVPSEEIGQQGVGDLLETKAEPVDKVEDSAIRPSTSLRRRSARPPSARPAAPRVKSVDTGDEQPMLEPRNHVPNIILDNNNAPEEEDENFVVAESSAQPAEYPRVTNADVSGGTSPQVGHGSLVTQILATKKDLEGDQRSAKVEIDKSELTDAAKSKQRERNLQEVERLRDCVQGLARGANPLGKRLDYLQEDLDIMQRELDMWTKESKYFVQALKSEESKSDTEVDRLKAQLKEAEDGISDQQARIFAVKSNILRQDARICKMISAAKL